MKIGEALRGGIFEAGWGIKYSGSMSGAELGSGRNEIFSNLAVRGRIIPRVSKSY